jgi:hypothetical protein
MVISAILRPFIGSLLDTPPVSKSICQDARDPSSIFF